MLKYLYDDKDRKINNLFQTVIFEQMNYSSVVLHNLSEYDYHLFNSVVYIINYKLLVYNQDKNVLFKKHILVR